MGSHVPEQQSSGKFLEAVLDDKINFNNHVNYVCKKVSKFLGLLCKLKISFQIKCLEVSISHLCISNILHLSLGNTKPNNYKSISNPSNENNENPDKQRLLCT